MFPLVEQSVNSESCVISVSGKGIWVENLQVLKLQGRWCEIKLALLFS